MNATIDFSTRIHDDRVILTATTRKGSVEIDCGLRIYSTDTVRKLVCGEWLHLAHAHNPGTAYAQRVADELKCSYGAFISQWAAWQGYVLELEDWPAWM